MPTRGGYQFRPDWSNSRQIWDKVWDKFVVEVSASQPVSVDILSVTVTPKGARYAEAPAGVGTEVRGRAYRRALYTHAPGNVKYRVTVPAGGRLDVGLGVLRADVPVTFRITAQPDGRDPETLLEEAYADSEQWAQRTIDLSHLQGQIVTLALETEADRQGPVALWAAPTLSGSRVSDAPNVIFYVIDAGGADYMSVYGYNRSTTPNLTRLAAEAGAKITARDSLEYWERRQMAVARGKAHAKQGTNQLWADILSAYLHKDRQGKTKIRRIEAFDRVRLETVQDVVVADRGLYNLDIRTAILCGSVTIIRGDNKLTGQVAEVNLTSGRARLRPGPCSFTVK